MGERGRKKSFESWLSDFKDKIDDEIRLGEGPCKTCEFCFPDMKDGHICADVHYGKKININNTTKRDCWSIGPDEYIRRRQKFDATMFSTERLKELYQAYLQDEKELIVKAAEEIVEKVLE